MKLTFLHPKVVRLAFSCRGKNDTRSYLNVVHLDLARNTITGTDGHRLAHGTALTPESFQEIQGTAYQGQQCAISVAGKIPVRAETVRLDTHTGQWDCDFGKKVLIGEFLPVAQVEKLPDISKFLAYRGRHGNATSTIGVNPAYLHEMAKAYGDDGLSLHMDGTDEPISVMFPHHPDGLHVIIMPIRLQKVDWNEG